MSVAHVRRLAVRVHFLTGQFHGRADGGALEWPPSPYRLLAAFVAAARRRPPTPERERALEWLETLPPPVIDAPSVTEGQAPRFAVPNNDLDVVAEDWARGRQPRTSPSELKTLKEVRPLWVSDRQPVEFRWDLAEDTGALGHLAALRSIAHDVATIGWGLDLVACDVTIDGETRSPEGAVHEWRPAGRAHRGATLRIPIPGSIAEMRLRHDAFRGRLRDGVYHPVTAAEAFARMIYRPAGAMEPLPCVAFALVDGESGALAAVSARHGVLPLAGRIRAELATAAESAGWSGPELERAFGVAADGTAVRTASVPSSARLLVVGLPSIEPRGDGRESVGDIRRILLVAPSPDAEEALMLAERLLPGARIPITPDRVAELRARDLGEPVVQRYLGEARCWTSVTPVVLPRHARTAAETEAMLRRALEEAGVAPPIAARANVEWRGVGYRAGVGRARDFVVTTQPIRPAAVHVRVTFDAPVPGPLVLGAGRWRGMGLLCSAP